MKMRWPAVVLLTLAAAGCSSGSSGGTSAPSSSAIPSPVATESQPATQASGSVPAFPVASESVSPAALTPAPVAISTASPTVTASPAATASPAPTPNPNLLSYERGAFIRRWSIGASTSNPEALAVGGGWVTDGPNTQTPELVFELPAVAQISQVTVTAVLPAGAGAQFRFGASNANDTTFSNVGMVTLSPPSGGGEVTGTLQGPIAARWLHVQIDRPRGAKINVESITATGTVAAPPAKFAGRWALADNVVGNNDIVFGTVKGQIARSGQPAGQLEIAAVERAGALIAATCNYDRDVWRGPIQGGTATIEGGGALNVVSDGSLLIGIASGTPVMARRTPRAPACDVPPAGKGSVIAIVTRYPSNATNAGNPKLIPGHRYETHLLPLISSDDLNRASAAVLAMSCTPSKDSTPPQQQALLDFVQRGHVLVIRDADVCSQSEYAFIPYPFTTAATGARGARGNVLSIADSSALASSDASDRVHYIDTAAYLKFPFQQIGDADIMQTTDQHWCGLMFAKNAAGISGWVRAYARYGKGVIIYDGFDVDDLTANVPQALALNRLAYGLMPSTDLPCNAHVASQLLLLSSVHRAVPFGSAKDFRFAFVVDHEGVKVPERVALSVEGERAPGWRASIDRHDLTLGASDQRVIVTVHVPANATATNHLYTLTATGEQGRKAQAAIELDVNEALAKELEKGGRARIYGIHFDVASARIQPRSEATIREIAQVLRSHPTWHMRVEGYTDSDGGAAYNLDLSNRRARSVVNDLVAHYSISRGRLKSAGYGLTHPVASNATDAGKALNRRVELVRL
jgi:outer membrane protein OmpA-like peptidoglycan-associated protein